MTHQNWPISDTSHAPCSAPVQGISFIFTIQIMTSDPVMEQLGVCCHSRYGFSKKTDYDLAVLRRLHTDMIYWQVLKFVQLGTALCGSRNGESDWKTQPQSSARIIDHTVFIIWNNELSLWMQQGFCSLHIRSRVQKFPAWHTKAAPNEKCCVGYIVPSMVTSTQMWKVSWTKWRLCWKTAKLFYFCHLKKLVRPETFGPYYVHILE